MPTRDYKLTYVVDASAALAELKNVSNALWKIERNSVEGGKAVQDLDNHLKSLQGTLGATAGNIHITTGAIAEAKDSMGAFRAEALAVGLAFQGFELGVQFFQSMGEGINKAREAIKEMASEVGELQGQMRELANLKGKDGPDDALTAQTIQFGIKTGMTGSQAMKFLEQMEGSLPAGLQKGNINRPVAEEVALETARFGQRVGLTPRTSGDLSGVIGQYQKVPNADAGIQTIGRVIASLNDGRGNIEPLTAAFINTAGSLVDEEDGPVGSLDELAAIYSAMSTHHSPTAAGTYTRKGINALRDFQGKQAPALNEMGITQWDAPMEAVAKLRTRLGEEAKDDKRADFALGELGFTDQAERKALIELVHDYDIIGARLKNQQAITGQSVRKKNEVYFSTKRVGIGQRLEAQAKGARAMRGLEQRDAELARMAAMTRMRGEGTLMGEDLAIADRIVDAGGFLPSLGIPSSFEQRVDKDAVQHLFTAMQNAGLGGEVDKIWSEEADPSAIKTWDVESKLKLMNGQKVYKYGDAAGPFAKPTANLDRLAKDPQRVAQLFGRFVPELLKRGEDPFGGDGGLGFKLRDAQKDRDAGDKFKRPRPPKVVPKAPPAPPGAPPHEPPREDPWERLKRFGLTKEDLQDSEVRPAEVQQRVKDYLGTGKAPDQPLAAIPWTDEQKAGAQAAEKHREQKREELRQRRERMKNGGGAHAAVEGTKNVFDGTTGPVVADLKNRMHDDEGPVVEVPVNRFGQGGGAPFQQLGNETADAQGIGGPNAPGGSRGLAGREATQDGGTHRIEQLLGAILDEQRKANDAGQGGDWGALPDGGRGFGPERA